MNAPPELPLSLRDWAAPVAFQVDSRTTLFIDLLTFHDFLQRATPQQRRVVHTQLAQLMQPREQARIHSTALATLGNTSSRTTALSLTTSHAQSQPLSISDFSLGFAKGLPKGMYHSGHSTVAFASDLVIHPLRTASQMKEALRVFSTLARSGQWEAIGEALSPEAHHLVTRWDNLSSYKRGELAGFVVGKHGTDFLLPAAFVKGVKGVQKLGSISKGVKAAEQTLLLESAASLGKGAKIEELVQVHRTTLPCRGLKTAEQTFLLESTASIGNNARIVEIVQLETRISNWLGEGTQFIRNKAGDPIFLSKDGLRKVRFDFNKPAPHESPHLHFDRLVDGEWQEISRVYPIDVPHK